MLKCALVLIGGGAGALLRYLAATAIMERTSGRFPLGTLVVNVTGSFLIGLLMTLMTERWSLGPNWRLLLIVGFLGGYTTFSSFEWESLQAMRAADYWNGLGNIAASNILGYAAVWIGAVVARQ